MVRRTAAVAAFVLAATLVVPSTRASARPVGAEAVSACRGSIGTAPEVGERSCRGVEAILRGFANGCRNLDRNSECYTADGRRTGEGHMATYLAGWTHRALSFQRALTDNVSLSRTTMLHTHNSSNSPVYGPTLTTQDPNQIYSMRDQLRMDIRAIEMDLHWFPSAHGSPKTNGRAVVLCHGRNARVHVGCSADLSFREGLKELRQWLLLPENRAEFVLLYLQNELGNRKAHSVAAREIAQGLGDLVARPPAGQRCAPLATSVTPAALRATGHRVLLVGNCGPDAWGTWVHERGPSANWVESSSGPGNDYPGMKNGCAAERSRTGAGRSVVRWWEDSTVVSAMADGVSSQLTIDETAAMARCGATLIGFDQLAPEDPRLAAAVWSWAPGSPSIGGPSCTTSGADSRFRNADCGAIHSFACMVNPDTWRVTKFIGPAAAGQFGCTGEFPGSTFAVPANGWENTLLRDAAAGKTVWLNFEVRG